TSLPRASAKGRERAGTLGELTGVDRVTAYIHDAAERSFHRAYGWQEEGLDVQLGPPAVIGGSQFVWWRDHLLAEAEPIAMTRLSDLPSDAAEIRLTLTERGIRSFSAIPIAHRRRVLGFLAFSSIRQPKTWTEDSLLQLKLFGEILASAMLRREAEDALSEEKERAQVTLASIGDGVIRTDADGRIDYLNPVAEHMTGWNLEQAAGREVAEVYHVVAEATRRARRDPLALCRIEKRTVSLPGISILLARDGREFTIRDSVAPILGRGGELIGTVLVFKDLTEFRGLERQMLYAVSHDPLTGLLNRSEFEIHLEAALESAREKDLRHALLFLDLSQFKLVNDACGHVAGDELLRQVSTMLKSRIRQGDLLSRLGGDEFGILLLNATSPSARHAAGNLMRAFRELRFNWGGQVFEVGVSIGIVGITAASESVIEVLKAADAACSIARESGLGSIHEYVCDDEALVERHGQVQWVHRIRRALAHDRFSLYHQKIQPLGQSGRPMLHEILVRMVGEGGEHIPPGAFIPVAERYHLAPALDRWVVRQSLRLLSSDQGSALGDDPVSINLSGQSLGEDDFLHFLIEQIELSGLKTDRIFFEITETAAVANLARAIRFIETLRERGCRFILDDFGSGLSSFAYLKNLPVDVLKIDGEFVRTIEKDPIHRAMVGSIHQIGHLMGLPTIAEWVENEATYDILSDLGVDFVQGYFIHRPEPLHPSLER
ncbi:MAG: EAL domain-containing protein, partial [Thermoanaerobaculia bacterium]|nr:EAL domain-containing protein [Thermoanaerobaculia bacterium]